MAITQGTFETCCATASASNKYQLSFSIECATTEHPQQRADVDTLGTYWVATHYIVATTCLLSTAAVMTVEFENPTKTKPTGGCTEYYVSVSTSGCSLVCSPLLT